MPDMYALYVCIMAGALVRGVLCSARRRDKRGVLCSARRRDWLPFLLTLPAAARPLLTGTSHAPRGSGAPDLVPRPAPPPGVLVRAVCRHRMWGVPGVVCGLEAVRGSLPGLHAARPSVTLRARPRVGVCLICMPYLYVLYVFLTCMPYMCRRSQSV